MSDKILAYKNGNREFEIKIGTFENPVTYQVISMFDADAPDGFQKLRTTKIISPDIYNRVRLGSYDIARRAYDTGMTKESKALIRLYPDDVNRTAALKTIKKQIFDPLSRIYEVSDLEPRNIDFWDRFVENIQLDNSYDTSDPLQLAKLYFLILHGKLCPAGLESEGFYKGSAQYAVENKDSVVNVEQKRKMEISRAKSRFITLLDTDKEALEALLEYMGITLGSGLGEELLNDTFTRWLEKDENQNPKQFLEFYKNHHESESGRKVVTVFKDLKKLFRDKKIKKEISGFYLGDTFIGKDFKEAAKNVLKEDILLDKVYAALEK